MRRTYFSLLIFILALVPAAPSQAQSFIEPPMFADQVKAGKLPPVEKRVPAEPAIATFDLPWQEIGRHGGMITNLMERAADIRRMSAYGYARLAGYVPGYKIEADILKSFDVKDGREFTFTLRKSSVVNGWPSDQRWPLRSVNVNSRPSFTSNDFKISASIL